MKAAACYKFDAPLVVETVELDLPQRDEVKVRIAAVAICHSDIHIFKGEWGGGLPVIAGHEAAGVVEEVGEGVTNVRPGDHVVVSLLRSCGRCFYCTTDVPYRCEADYPRDQNSPLHTKSGDPISIGLRTAAFAEYAIVHHSQVVPIPPEVPLDRAALLGCGVITGVGAVINTAQVKPNSGVVVIGAGGVGLNAVQGARFAGAHPIIAVDLLDSKLSAAQAFGATHAINAKEVADPIEAVRELTSGRGADYAIVTVGSAAAVKQAFRMIRSDGAVVVVGIPELSAELNVPVAEFVFGGPRTIMGSFMGSTRLSVDVPRLVTLYQHGSLKLDELVTGRYPLEEINEAIESVERGEALRNVIMFP